MLEDPVWSAIQYMRDVRNRAVHDPELTLSWSDAEEYKTVAARVLAALG